MAGHQAKTIMAQSPFAPGAQGAGLAAPGQPMAGTMPAMGGAPAPGGAYGANQKTMIAGMSPPMMGGQPQSMQQPGMMPGQHPGMMGGQPGMMPQGTPQQGFPPPGGGGGPQKTVMLQPTEGVVSMAGRPAPIAQAQSMPGHGMMGEQQGASTTFWIVSLILGIAVGVVAYIIVLQVQ